MKINNSKNFQVGDRVRHERGGTGTVRAVEYTSTHESNCVWETTSDGRRHLSCDEVEVDWNPPYDKLSASRTSSIYLTKI